MEINWAGLRAAATEVMRRAYAPYSGFPVGAAGLADDGRVVVGCNVENASYGLVLCAECGVVSALHASGGGRLTALSCVDGAGQPLMPCGRCRQLLWENGGPDCLVDAVPQPLRMAELLPHAFDSADLDAARAAVSGPVPAGAGGVPARLAAWRGRGTVFVHLDMAGGQRVWTGYWERSAGPFADAGSGGSSGLGAPAGMGGPSGSGEVAGSGAPAGPGGAAGSGWPNSRGEDEPVGILEEAPTWAEAADAVAWGRARTPRVVVVDADGATFWAGEGEPPAGVGRRWPE